MNLFKNIKEKVTSPEFKDKLKKAGMEISETAKNIAKGAGKLSNKSQGYWESQMKSNKGKKGNNSLFG